MATTTSITIISNDDMLAALRPDALSPKESAERLAKYMNKSALGCGLGMSITMSVNQAGGVAATGTVTLSALANNDTITVGGVVFTAKTSGATGNAQFNLGASDTTAAAAAAVKMSAHPSLIGVASATSAAAVITVTAAAKSQMGNQITLAISAHGSVSGANLSGGANPTSVVLNCGL
jgi:phage tail sheath gpL-like